jgi:AAA family ATP:ADP antiporter
VPIVCHFIYSQEIGVAAILIAYGVILSLGLIGYATYPEYTTVLVVVIISRVFEYGFNKPTRETVFTALKKQDRYKSTVFLDTFIAVQGKHSVVGLPLKAC